MLGHTEAFPCSLLPFHLPPVMLFSPSPTYQALYIEFWCLNNLYLLIFYTVNTTCNILVLLILSGTTNCFGNNSKPCGKTAYSVPHEIDALLPRLRAIPCTGLVLWGSHVSTCQRMLLTWRTSVVPQSLVYDFPTTTKNHPEEHWLVKLLYLGMGNW